MTAKPDNKIRPLTYSQFAQDLAGGNDPGPSVFFYGDEPYLIDKAVNLLVETRLDSASRDYGLRRMDGSDVTWGELENALTSRQMFASKKVVVLSNPGRLPASARTAMTDYLRNPAEDTWLGLIDPQPDWRKKPYTDWSGFLLRVECNRLAEDELAVWIRSLVEVQDIKIEPEQSNFLMSVSEGDMQTISGILEKVFLLIDKGGTISEEVLETATGSSRRYSWDSFLLAVAKRDSQALWTVVDFLQKQTPSPTYFTQLLSRTFQGALIAKQFQGDIPFAMDLYKSIGYFGQARSRISMISKSYSRQEIIDALSQIRATDREMKNSSKSSTPLIYQMLARIVISENNQEPAGVL